MQILHVSEAEVRETKMMGETPIIIVAVRTHIFFARTPLPYQYYLMYYSLPCAELVMESHCIHELCLYRDAMFLTTLGLHIIAVPNAAGLLRS